MVQRKATRAMRLLSGIFFLVALPLSAAIAQVSSEATVHVDRAVLAYDDKRYEDALKDLAEALRLNPQSVDALYYQGLTYLALNRAPDARAAWEEARRLSPADVDVAFQLGVLYFNEADYEKAAPLLREAYQAEPKRQNLGYYLGVIEYARGNYREALAFLSAAVPSDPNFAQLTRFYAGLAMSSIGFTREARAEIDEALRLQPISPLTTPAQRFREVLATAVEPEKFFRGDLRLGLFYDTNVPAVPNISADPDATASRQQQKRRKSEGELALLNLSYAWLRTSSWEGTVSYRLFHTYNNHLTEFNTQSHTPSVGLTYRSNLREMPYFAGVQYTYDYVTLGNERFIERWILNPFLSVVENSWNVTTLQFRFQAKDFVEGRGANPRNVRNAENYMAGPLHFFLFDQGRHYLKLGYQYDLEDAKGKNLRYRGHRMLTGGRYSLPWWDIQLRYDLDFHWRFHERKHSQFPASAPGTRHRSDQEAIHFVTISKNFVLDSRQFTASVDYLFDNNNSNLRPFDYHRHVVTTSLTWHF